MKEVEPNLSDEEADSLWRVSNKRLFGEGQHLYSHPDVSSFTGGNTLKVTAQIHHSARGPRHVKIALDTQSDVTTCLRHYLMDVHPIVPDEVNGVGGSSSFSEEGTLYIYSELRGQRVGLPALVAPPHQLPSECVALLGVPALLELEVAVDKHLRLPRFSPLECHLGEKKLREWLTHHPDSSIDTSPFDINAIQICPSLSSDQIKAVKEIILKYAKVFEGHENSLPKPFATEPITLKFKHDAQPQSVPQPRWTLAQKEIVTRWAEEGLRNGSLEPSTSAWSSRVHLVLKPPSNTTAELANLKDCKLRPCGDYRLVNSQIEKIAPNLPTGLHQLEQASGHNIYFEADSVACYHSFRLAPGASREALAVWTPIGLMQPTVLPFGQKNSGTEAQGPYLLAAKKLRQVSNYVDDWLGYSNDFKELLRNFEEFLAVCLEHNITLNTSKTKFGFPSAQFFGFKVDKKGTRLADKHLCPIRNMVPPTDISELRRTLGLFVVSRKYLQHYALITKPLTDLLKGKQPVFKWESEQQQAYEYVRDALLAGIHLAAPDFSLPFHLQTDASEDGKGGTMYQLATCPIAEQYPYCKDKHAPDMMSIIAFFSKAWTEAQRLRPPFYLEADSLLWCTNETKFYALSSPFPLYTYSDHMPLQWMRKSEKGPVSQFLIEQLSELDTVHQYIQGHLNSVADAASRYPLLGPKRLAPRGLAHSVQEVLSRLPVALRQAAKINVHAGTYTSDLKLIVQTWISGNKGNVQAVAPAKKGFPAEADLSIMIPRPEDSPVTLALYLMSNMPFAILIPNDLLSESFADKIYPEANAAAIKLRFQAAGKLQILVTQMTWVVGNIPEYCAIEMFSQDLRTAAPITGPEVILADTSASTTDTFDEPVPTIVEEWIAEQNKDPAFLQTLNSLPGIACREGLYLFAPDDVPPRIFVPPQTREPLIRFTHARMFHLGQAKVAERLLKSYYWPTLRKDTRRILTDCPECEVEKARQQEAHGLFRARPNEAPRARYAMDFQGQGTAITGETEALGIIDTTARFVTVIALPNRRVQTLIPAILDQIVFRHGPPEILHCDEAPEFMSELLRALAEITETTLTTTLAHNAKSNGTIEIFWRYWNRCMKLLPDDQYNQWPRFVSRIVFAYNTAPHQSLGGISPYELYYGVPARDTFSRVLNLHTDILPQSPDDTGDIENARLFALAVKTSTAAFVNLAQNHDQYMKNETAIRLNQKGAPRQFIVGVMVKARFPPTKAEMDATGRRSNHISAWRGPCRVITRLSSTSYKVMQLDNNREFERSISNLLPWNASGRKKARNATYVEDISTPFLPNEFIAVRDEPASWFYLARVTTVTKTAIIVHYYGTRSPNLALATFYPGWHLSTQNHIRLSLDQPEHFIRYSGTIEVNAINSLLVARNLALTSAHRLTSQSRRLLMPVRDELFIFQ
jgi:transposase InsO family protein